MDNGRETEAFPETADIVTSSDDYAMRFAGATGQWMLGVQEAITIGFLEDTPGATVLDVGGGHGQLAIPMCNRDFPVTVLASSESCRKRISGTVDSGKCAFKVGNVMDMPFEDKSFDTVIAFRMLTHCRAWPGLIEEMCRIAKHSVIADYPTSQSMNRIAPMLFKAKKKIEGDTRTWALFRHAEVTAEFEKHGFVRKRRKGQFFLPMVLHRALKCRPVSAGLEALCRTVGLTSLWGSPVIAEWKRNTER